MDIAIFVSNPQFFVKAKALADRLSIPLLTTQEEALTAVFVLEYDMLGLSLRACDDPRMKPLRVDYSDAELLYRQQRGFREEGLARAMGLKGGSRLAVIDATAGLGRDALMMASWGCDIRMIERSPIVAALLEDAFERAPLLREKLMLIVGDAKEYLQHLEVSQFPDIIYLDPMFPVRNKSAAPKKEMQMLRLLLGADEDTEALLEIALMRAKKRVVLKRHHNDPCFEHHKPSHQWVGQSTRFDIFMCGT